MPSNFINFFNNAKPAAIHLVICLYYFSKLPASRLHLPSIPPNSRPVQINVAYQLIPSDCPFGTASIGTKHSHESNVLMPTHSADNSFGRKLLQVSRRRYKKGCFHLTIVQFCPAGTIVFASPSCHPDVQSALKWSLWSARHPLREMSYPCPIAHQAP